VDKSLDFVWCCRAIHEIAVGLSQIHRRDVFHQDLKPSNVLVRRDGPGIKIADLGRSHCSALDSPNGNWAIPGLKKYAPPEQLYGFKMPDADRARMAADLYHFGSLITFLFGGMMFTPALLQTLREEFVPAILFGGDSWGGTFEEILPHLIEGYDAILVEFEGHLRSSLPSAATRRLIPGVVSLTRMLTHPDPRLRGDPKTRSFKHSNPYDLQRIISNANSLSAEAQIVKYHSDAATAQ
jgi:serine/threonine protein kinase